MPNDQDLWYRLGYALEMARAYLPSEKEKGEAGSPGRRARMALRPARGESDGGIPDVLLAVGAGTALNRLLALWPRSRRPGLLRLARAGAAGAAASFLTELLRPVLVGRARDRSLGEVLTDVLLSGAGRGLLYASVVEPRIPAPATLQGSAYGLLEYVLSPWGGLEEVAGSAAPHGKLPALSVLFQGREEEENADLLEHLAFGIALALLYDA